MKLSALASILNNAQIYGDPDVEISRIHCDSKSISRGDLFFPKKGERKDGLDFVNEAIQRGASGVLVPSKIQENIPQLVTSRSAENLKALCLHLYNHPTKKLGVIGVTGTNGKTSICHFIEALLRTQFLHTGYIGTTQYRWNNSSVDSQLTTPMFEELQYYFAAMAEENVSHVVMECSSHGIETGRIDHIDFDICVYTNLTHEHLDFHHTMQEYEEAKKKLFVKYLSKSSKKNKHAVINIHDPIGKKWVQEKIFPDIITYGLKSDADIYPVSIETENEGMKISLSVFGEKLSFFMPTLGVYNVLNIMAAIAVVQKLGVSTKKMTQRIEEGIWVPGRLQKVPIDAPFTVIVDYAYTEDALRNVLQTLVPFRKNRIIAVFGCGGDRDRTRRPKMAKAVYEYADRIIVTTDNPRTEVPEKIIEEILTGIENESEYQKRVSVYVDRREAIAKSLEIAEDGDIVLIAGKGHETYQEIHGVRYPFDDREIVKTCWKSK